MRKSNIFIYLTLLILASCSDNKNEPKPPPKEESYTPVVVSVFEPSAPVQGSDNKYHLLYGLQLANASPLFAMIDKIEIVNPQDHSTIKSFEGKELQSNLSHLNGAKAQNRELEKDGSRIFFVKLSFNDKKAIPKELTHNFSLDGATGPGSQSPGTLSYEAADFAVSHQKPLVLSPPLKGTGWVIFNGCCSSNGVHQDSLMPVKGELYNAQRFAIDFMKLNDKNRLYEGDPSDPANWFCYGQDVQAVGNGEVVSVLEGLPDQPPGSLPDPNSLTLKTVTGNHVIIKIDNNVYAFYGHLRKDSLKVKKGDKVKKGQKIAQIGNSGNTSAPHLHLHLMSTPSPIGSAPVPYTYDSFKLIGTINKANFYEDDDMGKQFGNRAEFKPEQHKDQLPMDLNIVEF